MSLSDFFFFAEDLVKRFGRSIESMIREFFYCGVSAAAWSGNDA